MMPQSGTLLNERYRLLEPLSRGPVAYVYEAVDVARSVHVAIKLLSPEHLNETIGDVEQHLRRFRREARVLTRLRRSPHVVKLLEHGCDDQGLWFIVMERLVGQPLNAIMGQGLRLLSVAQFLRIAAQLARGLESIHRAGVIHRDVSPDNLMVIEQKNARRAIRYIDFHLARVIDSPAVKEEEGAAIGKPAYMAPEQALEGQAGPFSDVYSLGVVLYEMLTGILPIPIRGFPDLRRHQTDSPWSLADLPEGRRVGKDVRDLLMACLSRSPESRPHPRELVEILERAWAPHRDSDRSRIVTLDGETTEAQATDVRPIPEQVGPFAIKQRLRESVHGEQYLATNADDPERTCVIKVARMPRFSGIARTELLRRARLMSGAEVHELVPVLGVHAEPGVVVVAQAQETAPTLAEILQNEGPLPLDRVRSLGISIARGLHGIRATAASLHHGTLTADRVYVTGVHAVRLADGGLSDGSEALSVLNPHESDRNRALAQELVDTLAPEVVRTGRSDARSDFYALGCLLFEMLTGQTVTRGNAVASLYQHATEPTPSLNALRPELPEPWSVFVRMLLSKEPRSRPATALEVIQAMERLPVQGEVFIGFRRARTGILIGLLLLGLAAWLLWWLR